MYQYFPPYEKRKQGQVQEQHLNFSPGEVRAHQVVKSARSSVCPHYRRH